MYVTLVTATIDSAFLGIFPRVNKKNPAQVLREFFVKSVQDHPPSTY